MLCWQGTQHSGYLNEAKEWAGELLSGQTRAGKLLNGVVFIISICSQLTYFYDAQQGVIEKCVDQFPNTLKVLGIMSLLGFWKPKEENHWQ